MDPIAGKPHEPTPRPSAPRIGPVPMSSASIEQAALLEPLGGDQALNLFGTLANNPGVMKSWLRFGGHLLLQSSLPERDREIVILRVAGLCGSDYEWGQHIAIAREAGLSDEEMRQIGQVMTTVDGTLGDEDLVLLRATDQLVVDHYIDEQTWALLSSSYDDSQLAELTLLAGHYAMLAGALSSMGVQTEGSLPKVGEI